MAYFPAFSVLTFAPPFVSEIPEATVPTSLPVPPPEPPPGGGGGGGGVVTLPTVNCPIMSYGWTSQTYVNAPSPRVTVTVLTPTNSTSVPTFTLPVPNRWKLCSADWSE